MLGKNRRPQREKIILVEDTNAMIAKCNIGYEEAMGSHGLGDMDNNEKRFADRELVTGVSVFPQRNKECIKPLGFSTNHTTENKVDHLCISREIRIERIY